MPEQAEWRFETVTKPMFDLPLGHTILTGRVLTAKGDEIIENGFVEIEGKAIKRVGRRSDLWRGGGTRDRDRRVQSCPASSRATGIWPGTGFTISPHSRWTTDRRSPPTKCASNMLVNLKAGVTTFRDLGVNRTNLFAKQAVAQGIFPGPRLLVCGQAIVQTGGHTYWCCREAAGPMKCAARFASRCAGARTSSRSWHVTTRSSLPMKSSRPSSTRAIATSCPSPPMPPSTLASIVSSEFGIDVVEHGGSMSEETIGLLVEKKVPIVTTFAPVVVQSQPEIARKFNIPEWKIAERQKAVADPKRYEGLVNAAKAGVTIAFGTDCGSPAVAHDVIAPELKFMVKVGVKKDAYDAIRSATVVAAGLNKLDKVTGTLEAGKLADVIVVDGDVLADLDAIARVKMTFLEGRRMV